MRGMTTFASTINPSGKHKKKQNGVCALTIIYVYAQLKYFLPVKKCTPTSHKLYSYAVFIFVMNEPANEDLGVSKLKVLGSRKLGYYHLCAAYFSGGHNRTLLSEETEKGKAATFRKMSQLLSIIKKTYFTHSSFI